MTRTGGILPGLCLALLLAPAAARAQIVQGAEFQIAAGIEHLETAGGADGNVVFVWLDRDDNPFGVPQYAKWHIYARAFSPAGVALGDAIRLDEDGRVALPAIAALPGGGYVAVFSAIKPSGAALETHGLRLSAAGAPQGDPFLVAADTDLFGSPYAPTVTSTPTGPVVLWREEFIWSRRYDADLAPLGLPVPLSDTPVDSADAPDSAALFDGLAVVWYDYDHIPQRRLSAFDADGERLWTRSPLEQGVVRRVATGPSGEIAVGGFHAGKLSVAWFTADGDAVGPPVLVADEGLGAFYERFDLEFDSSGDLLVAWVMNGVPMRARILDRVTHQPLAPAVQLAPEIFRTELRIARLLDGRFLVASRLFSFARGTVVAGCSPPPSCGDQLVAPPCEQCDDGAANDDSTPDACRSDCRAARCGDGVQDSAEECDDANVVDGDGCDRNCLIETCGNGRQEGGEDCDDSNLDDDDGCDSTCQPTGCGSGVITGDEECDDGNGDDGDGCDAACLIETCGNGRQEGGENCDDANLDPSDGCEPDCSTSPEIDAVLERVPPLDLHLSPSTNAIQTTVRLRLRNADMAKPLSLLLSAADDTCPAGTVAALPDFDPFQAGSQDSIVLEPGERATAEVSIAVSRAAFASPHPRAAKRCTVQLSVGPLSGGALDLQPSNNRMPLVVDVYDSLASPTAAEGYLKALRPRRFSIPVGVLGAEQRFSVSVRSTQPGAVLGLSLDDGTCPPGTLSLLSFDSATGRGKLLARASRAFFTTPVRVSPGRCVATILGSANPDVDSSNDAVPLVIEVIDQNDL